MKKITVIGMGYVGLVTGVCLSEIGHRVICLDIDETKVDLVKRGKSPFYEPGLEELLASNIKKGSIHFTTDYTDALSNAEVIYIAVDTPVKEDGSANLHFIEQVAHEIAFHITKRVIIVMKSTVPVGTNEYVKEMIQTNLRNRDIKIDIVSNPEFLREGSAIEDMFNGDRILIGSENESAALVLEEINKAFQVPIVKTDIRSAEMIKYTANAFLAMKISFINEISNLCEKVDANIDEVAYGIGLDSRIGNQFLQAGIGYGGSCFPKDTNTLLKLSDHLGYHFKILDAVISVNNMQVEHLIGKILNRFGQLNGKKVAILGLAFKPNTDDMRSAPSLKISQQCVNEGAKVYAYDPVAMEKAKGVLPREVVLTSSIEDVLKDADVAIIVTEWKQFREIEIRVFEELMKEPIIFDGRNCYPLDRIRQYNVEYHSIGRPVIQKSKYSHVKRR